MERRFVRVLPMLSGRVPSWTIVVLLAAARTGSASDDAERTIRAVKSEEQAAGIRPTGNFAHADPTVIAYYRCYYTGKLELPASYDDLKLRKGTKNGCRINEKKYDVFFYPIEAVASGHVPVTQALAAAPVERLATVVSHEDFHIQVRELPDPIAEAATTLVGFVAGSAAAESIGRADLRLDAELFLRKAAIVNRSYERLSRVYQSVRVGVLSKARALEEKQEMLRALEQECGSVQPAPQSFNRCVSAPNNAGLAFDYTYTRYYPLVYAVYEGCGHDLRCTVQKIEDAPRKVREAEVVRYLASLADR